MQLCLLAQHLKALEEALQDESCRLHTSSSLPPHPPSTSPPHTTSHTAQDRSDKDQSHTLLNNRTFSETHSQVNGRRAVLESDDGGGSPHEEAGSFISIQDRGSPHIPEIYLTPSLPPHSALSSFSSRPSFPLSPSPVPPSPQPSLTSPSPQSSLSSSLSQLDPFTPDSSAPHIHTAEVPETHCGVQDTYSGVSLTNCGVTGVLDKPQREMEAHKEHASKKALSTYSGPNISDCPPVQRPDCVVTSRAVGPRNSQTNSSVLEWLLSSRDNCHDDHSSHEDHRESVARDETDCYRDTSPFDCDEALSVDDGCDRETQATPLSERVAADSPTGHEPLASPPVSCESLHC